MSDLSTTLDITQLAKYINKVEEVSTVNKMMAPTYLRDFIVGQDIAAALLAKAIQEDGRAKAKLEHAEAVAFLQNAKAYLDANDIKDTAGAREKYVDIDPDVIQAKDNKAKTEALVTFLKGKLNVLRMAHDDLKKITYADTNMTSWEGM